MLNRIQRFFREVAASCYDMEFYRSVRASKPGRSVRYAAALIGALTLVGVVLFVPGLFVAKTAVIERVRTSFPDGTRFALSRGELTTNMEMPFEAGTDAARLVIDTRISGDAIPEGARTGTVIIGSSAAFFPSRSPAGHEAVAFEGIPDFSVTKEGVLSALEAIGVVAVTLIAIGFVIGWALLTAIGITLYVLSMSLALMFISRWVRVPLRFGQWVASGYHIITLPLLLQVAFGNTFGRIPLGFTVIYALFAYAIITDERTNPTSPLPAHEEPAGPPAPPAPTTSAKKE